MFSDPAHNIEQLGLSDGLVVADLGAGSGFYTMEAAKAVAPTGRVYAIDVQKDLLDRLKNEARRLHVRGIETLSGDIERLGGTKIREASCDVVMVANVLFMIEDKKTFLAEARRILKPKGRLLLVDWSGSFSQMGPHADHIVYKEEAMKLARANGFTFEREIAAGAHHYGMIFRNG
ncbi:MAG TPA: methyltransferase domain-containing protein [Candidatus Paceibacterota bacterium]|jgi:Methylase involved in ubiquinone/menaquinone biosynthesis